jgi:hypothetical protein
MRLNEGKQNQLNFREMKQTAVEWYAQQLGGINATLLDKARKIEKEDMVDFAYKYGNLTTREIADSFDKEYKTNEK